MVDLEQLFTQKWTLYKLVKQMIKSNKHQITKLHLIPPLSLRVSDSIYPAGFTMPPSSPTQDAHTRLVVVAELIMTHNVQTKAF